jgi:hypothetical protein
MRAKLNAVDLEVFVALSIFIGMSAAKNGP